MSGQILALDTATEACSVALLSTGCTFERSEIAQQKHALRILPLIDEVLNAADIALHQLDALAFGCGPGSFTGMRIATSVAQGLAYGATLPVIGVSTLATLAQGAERMTNAQQVLVAVDARMGEVYWAEYYRDATNGWQTLDGEHVLLPEQACARMQRLSGAWAIAGSGWQAYPQLYTGHTLTLATAITPLLPHAVDILPFAIRAVKAGNVVTAEQVTVSYLRNDIAQKPCGKG